MREHDRFKTGHRRVRLARRRVHGDRPCHRPAAPPADARAGPSAGLLPGERMLLFTDGNRETGNDDGELEGLTEVLGG